mmetsp:Transcript_7472/g.24809  ORF Transcript_7472/g.24809 Transcript_7472/m.24809 type:complete len:915 (+) Transcript_7472:548-3292(+)
MKSILQPDSAGDAGGAAAAGERRARPQSARPPTTGAPGPPVPSGPPAKYRPPFWDSKRFGEPYGAWAAGAAPKKPQRQVPLAGAGQPAPAPPVEAKRRPHTPVDLGNRVQELEDIMRKRLKKIRTVACTEKMHLQQAFSKVDLRGTKRVSVEQFIKAWARLELKPSPTIEETKAIFNKYGQDRNGQLPWEVFVQALLVGRSRLVGMSGDVRKGAFVAGEPASHIGKILYPPCRKGVFPPTGWRAEHALRSAEPPDARLTLEFVYGYGGLSNLSNNLWYTAFGEVAYYSAGVGILYNQTEHTQRFFLGHDDDIKCVAISPDRTLIASGQVGHRPICCVWGAEKCDERARLVHPEVRGVIAVEFSSDARTLVTVGSDNNHSVFVWNWETCTILAELKGCNGLPPQVYGVRWRPDADGEFLTYGVNHIKWWNRTGGKSKGTWVQTVGNFGKEGQHTVMSAVYLANGRVLTGTPGGQICVWKDAKLIRTVRAHSTGAPVTRPDGSQTFGGVRCLKLRSDGKVLLSGGADGFIIRWDVSSGDLKDGAVLQAIAMKSPYAAASPPMFRGLDSRPGSDVFIAGTARCDIWEVDESPEVIIPGHSADLYCIAWHPLKPNIFASAAETNRLCLWDAANRQQLRAVALGAVKLRSAAFSPDGTLLAAGCKNGGVHVVDAETLQPLHWVKTFETAVDDIRFCPNSRFLAAASHDTFIDIFSVDEDFARIGRCSGHSATVTHIDWSADGSILATNSGAYEILYFNSHGRQVKQNQRDTDWDTYTCILGFPVMGIWPDGADGTDINAVDRSHGGRHVVAADDYGGVRLFNYPCVVQDAPCQIAKGHSSHVMCARFSADDRWVLSAGGHDRAIFQWRFAPAPAPKKASQPPWAPPAEGEAPPAQERRGKAKAAWGTPPAARAANVRLG